MEEYYTKEYVCKKLNITERTLAKLRLDGKVPSTELNARVFRFPKLAFDAFIANNTKGGSK